MFGEGTAGPLKDGGVGAAGPLVRSRPKAEWKGGPPRSPIIAFQSECHGRVSMFVTKALTFLSFAPAPFRVGGKSKVFQVLNLKS
jgi:hypothetical protein